MNESTKNKVEGAGHGVKGTVKEKVGQATNSPDLEKKGHDEKTAGKAQKKIGEVEEAIQDAQDDKEVAEKER